MNKCKLCLKNVKNRETLCYRHKKCFIFDSTICGYRLKKANNGTSTRYIEKKYHSHEISLIKIVENYYGPQNIVTEYHPLWAVSTKGSLLEFDIFIKNKGVLIEYNGIQHYKFIKRFHKNIAGFYAQQERDTRKAVLAHKNGFLLVIFRYDEPIVADYVIKKIEGAIKNGKKT